MVPLSSPTIEETKKIEHSSNQESLKWSVDKSERVRERELGYIFLVQTLVEKLMSIPPCSCRLL